MTSPPDGGIERRQTLVDRREHDRREHQRRRSDRADLVVVDYDLEELRRPFRGLSDHVYEVRELTS